MLIVHDDTVRGEREFEVREYDGGPEAPYQAVRVHPWHRYQGSDYESYHVFVSVGNYNVDGTEQRIADEEPVWNIIVDRTEFVEGLLRTFPELTRKEA